MGDVFRGLEAGFIATVFLVGFLFVQHALGIVPEFNLINLLMASAGAQDRPALGWGLMFMIGTVLWGLGYATVSRRMRGPHWLRGMAFGVGTWFVMMFAFLPTAGLPAFAQGMGFGIPVFALVMHLVYGAVLGASYQLLVHYLPSEVDENA